ncbi:hypothetical protein OSCI_4120038 [Kamptonema sp. PCC 6506]|nr:hypothetical protein OSCI_4120038 [Kamptonema sp. PCC 6506]
MYNRRAVFRATKETIAKVLTTGWRGIRYINVDIHAFLAAHIKMVFTQQQPLA